MRLPACEYCTRRKVKCDHENPCANCTKRQQKCVYSKTKEASQSSDSPLGPFQGLPRGDNSFPNADRSRPASNVGDAVIVREENQILYLENPIWRSWSGRYFGPLDDITQLNGKDDFILSQRKSSLFSSILGAKDATFRSKHPTAADASYLWETYFDRVHPINKVFFEQETYELKSKCIAGNHDFSDQEHAFIFAIYLLALQSLADDDPQTMGQREEQLNVYQVACEEAMGAFDFLKTYDIMTVRILVIYLYALLSQGITIGSWDIIGMIVRKAERLGMHRDGTYLGLTPFHTEKNRRLWWSIQELDLSCSSVDGATSMTLLAEWDSQLPLNIEDEDINPSSEAFPKERIGVTSISNCLWRYSSIREQINLRGPDGRKLGVSWAVNSNLSLDARKAILDKLETDLNAKFLQYCDPIQDLDLSILMNARSTMNFFRRAILSPGPAFKSAKHFTKSDFQALLDSSVRMLRYDRERYTNPKISRFQWHWHMFPWSALIHVLIELRKEDNLSEVEKLWEVCISTYMGSKSFKTRQYDKRKVYAAKLFGEAWKYLQNLRSKLELPVQDTPEYLTEMLRLIGDEPLTAPQKQGQKRKRNEMGTLLDESGEGQLTNFGFDSMDFENLDWLFWEDNDSVQITGFAA